MFEAAATSISSTYRLTDDDFRTVSRSHVRIALTPIFGILTGLVFGTLGLPDNERPPVAWLISALMLVSPPVLGFWLTYRFAERRNLQTMPGIDASWYRLTVAEGVLTTEDDTVIQIQRYDRFRSFRTTTDMLILVRANRSVVLVPLDRVLEDVRRQLLDRLTKAGVGERPRPSIVRQSMLFALPALFMFVLFGLGQGN